MSPILLSALLLAAPAESKKPLESIARIFLEHAAWAKEHGQKGEAAAALREARDAGADGVDALLEEVAALEEAPPAADLASRARKARAEAAKLYDKLGEPYLVKAAELDPTKARLAKLLGVVKQSAGNQAKVDDAGRVLVRLRDLDPDGPSGAIELEMATKDVAPLKSPKHPMVGYVSLPDGWKRKASYPVLVAVDGAGSGFLGAARGFAKARASRKFIVLAPCSLSNTNEFAPPKYPYYAKELLDDWGGRRIDFDLAGLEALLETVKARFGGEEKIGITGFSGGGNLCYGWTARHSDRVLFSAPACPNFAGMGFREAAPVADGGPPVRIFTGEKDEHRFLTFGKTPPGIEQQTDSAVEALTALGFKDLRRTMLPGVGHSNCVKQVWDTADEVLGAK